MEKTESVKRFVNRAILKICSNGHRFYKSSDCDSCPVCEQLKKPSSGFLSTISAPARRALISHSIVSMEDLAKYTEQEILQLHGIGPSTLPKLHKALKEYGMSFKKK
jgi:hypothetical protein